jgi:hypothetical protein
MIYVHGGLTSEDQMVQHVANRRHGALDAEIPDKTGKHATLYFTLRGSAVRSPSPPTSFSRHDRKSVKHVTRASERSRLAGAGRIHYNP